MKYHPNFTYNDVFRERTKQIDIDCHFLRHHVYHAIFFLQSVSFTSQLIHEHTKCIEETTTSSDFIYVMTLFLLKEYLLQLIDIFIEFQPPTDLYDLSCKLKLSSSHQVEFEGDVDNMLSF